MDNNHQELTERERELCPLVAEGLTNREIARRWWVSDDTVRNHLHNIYEKLEISGDGARVKLAVWWVQGGQVMGAGRDGNGSKTCPYKSGID